MERMALSTHVVATDDERPRLGEYDLLSRGDNWVALSSQEAVAVRLLLDRFGRVVGRERLTAALWPQATCSPSLLNQVIVRVRRRIEPLGLEVGTVRRRGYVLRDQVAVTNGNASSYVPDIGSSTRVNGREMKRVLRNAPCSDDCTYSKNGTPRSCG